MKPLKLNKETIEAVLKGATKIVLPIEIGETEEEILSAFKISNCPIEINQPYYVVEEFGLRYSYDLSGHNKYLINPPYEEEIICANNVLFEIFKKQNKLECADQMQPHQSRIPHIEFSNIDIKNLEDVYYARDFKFNMCKNINPSLN